MNDTEKVRIDDVEEFNHVLERMARSGIPVASGIGTSVDQLARTLDGWLSEFAIENSRGKPLLEIVQQHTELPILYQDSLLNWLQSNKSYSTLQPIVGRSTFQHRMHQLSKNAILQPLILLALFYAGMFFLSLVIYPRLEAFYSVNGLQPGRALLALSAIHDWLPLWSFAVPLVAFCLIVWMRSRRVPLSTIESELVGEASDVSTPANFASIAQQLRARRARQFENSHAWKWSIGSALVGGLIVLLFGVSLFSPMAETLIKLCRL